MMRNRAMHSVILHWFVLSGIAFGIAGCSTLSGSGPTAATIEEDPSVEIVNVTSSEAAAMSVAVTRDERAKLSRSVLALSVPANLPAFRFGPGVDFNVTLWSLSPLPSAAGVIASSSAPNSVPLGSYTVASDGAVVLPYIGSLRLSGLTLQQGQDLITRRFDSLGLVQKPSAVVEVRSVPQGRILVTGAVGQPRAITWSPSGITLGEALTQSLGDGTASLREEGALTNNTSAILVSVYRGNAPPVELSISAALQESIPLQPGDRVVVRKSPSIRVTVIGGGVRNNGVQAFGSPRPLVEVLAAASGLDGNVANDRAVFVMRQRQNDRPILYNFAWNKVQGLIASQTFPMINGDLVYVAEAPIVPVQRVVTLLYQLALPAQIAR